MDKDRLIAVQKHQICTLTDQSERLRRERDELIAVLQQLGKSGISPTGVAPIATADIPVQSRTFIYPTHRNTSLEAKRGSLQPRTRTKSLANGSTVARQGPPNSASDGW